MVLVFEGSVMVPRAFHAVHPAEIASASRLDPAKNAKRATPKVAIGNKDASLRRTVTVAPNA